jgi:hypothetical protein
MSESFYRANQKYVGWPLVSSFGYGKGDNVRNDRL